jgi:hypothetical protein
VLRNQRGVGFMGARWRVVFGCLVVVAVGSRLNSAGFLGRGFRCIRYPVAV